MIVQIPQTVALLVDFLGVTAAAVAVTAVVVIQVEVVTLVAAVMLVDFNPETSARIKYASATTLVVT